MGTAEDTRARILQGAGEVVLRDGVARLTLERAAAEAGVSKGGVLYHFGSRTALVTAMLERLSAAFEADLERLGAYLGGPGDFTRAYLEATFAPAAGDEDSRERRLGAAVIAGVVADPELLGPLRDRFAAWQRAIEDDGLPVELATAVRFAADGVWFADLFALAPLDGRRRGDVHRALRARLDDAVAAGRPGAVGAGR